MSRFVKASATYSSDKIDCPERKLFVAVLSQAVHDAFSSHVSGVERRQAQAWLLGNSNDFKNICENAGRDSSYVLTKIRRKILEKNGWNVNISVRVTSPRRRKRMRQTNKKHLTGNAYYAAKAKEQRTTSHTI
jgi:Tfp pilus assembly protein PilE